MIVGKQIYLRAVEEGDLPFLQALANDPYISNSVVGWGYPVSLRSQESWFERSLLDQYNKRFLICAKKTDEPLGLTGYWDIDQHNRTAVSGIKLDAKFSGKGYGVDSIMTSMAWAFYVAGLRRLAAPILDFNHASYALYVKKCGWRVEGIEKEATFKKGRWCDMYRVAILRSEFSSNPLSAEYIERVCPVDVNNIVKHT